MTTHVHLVGSVALDTAQCGISRARDPRTAERFLEVYAGAAAAGPAEAASV